MEPGKLRHKIVIQSLSQSRDSYGGVSTTYATENTRWASIEPLQGRELFNAQQNSADITIKITLRHYAGLSPTQRITHSSRTFEIISVINPNERDEMTIVMCKEVV